MTFVSTHHVAENTKKPKVTALLTLKTTTKPSFIRRAEKLFQNEEVKFQGSFVISKIKVKDR